MNRKSLASGMTGDPRQPLVCVVDDDPSVSSALASLLRSVGHDVLVYGSAMAFLKEGAKLAVGCLVVDIRLPGMSGLQFQEILADTGFVIPLVFITGHGDIEMSVQAMKGGAVDFLEKPFRDQDMIDAVAAALARDQKRRDGETATLTVRSAFEGLTSREKEVMAYVTAGLMNKQIAGELGLSEITVKIHRGNLMRKMGARSLAELIRMAILLAIRPPAGHGG